MKMMTSAYANKVFKSLEEDKAFWTKKEEASSTYVASVNEEPVIPLMFMFGKKNANFYIYNLC